MKRIGVIRRNGLGDLLCTQPFLSYLRLQEPTAEITLFVDARNSPLLPYLQGFDKSVVFPARGNKYWNLFQVAWAYKGVFDRVYSAKTSPMKLMNLFLYALKAKERIAYVDDRWHSRLINHGVPYLPHVATGLHQALKVLHLLEPQLEHVPSAFYPRLEIPSPVQSRYALPLPVDKQIILISVSTTRAENRLSPQEYATILNQLGEKTALEVWVTGLPQDKAEAENLVAYLRLPYQIHFPRNFDAFMVLLGTCDLFFVGDGGPGHLASALGKRGVVLFAGPFPQEWAPLSEKVTFLHHPYHVQQIGMQEIVDALEQRLEEVKCDRQCVRSALGNNPSESFSASEAFF